MRPSKQPRSLRDVVARQSRAKPRTIPHARRPEAGFTLVEILVTVAIVGVIIISLYTVINSNVALIQLTRENENATQILTEKFDTIRLYAWDQVTSNGFIPTTFTMPIDPAYTNGAAYYTGTITIATAPITESYSNDLRLITVRLDWVTGNRPCSRTMSSLVTKYGLQNYVY